MKGRNWKDWFKKAGIRAAHTVAQSAVACIGTAAVVESVCLVSIIACWRIIYLEKRCWTARGRKKCLG